ncbi:quinoprotein relay system zinc metallohydrolase 2 [Thiocapsa rosea]|uniref:Quinoprotein relay system zinc metallohydrolase 2 n=2 Tax=Thiocapsa rosea TaxID=69360 RepID=A0A495VCY4_9GAMM|nr:quinoprotein relay system zinc metallohydrolase 2 [Thiocapsa rosea]
MGLAHPLLFPILSQVNDPQGECKMWAFTSTIPSASDRCAAGVRVSLPTALAALLFSLPCPAAMAADGSIAGLHIAEIAPGIYLREGTQEETSPANSGHIANIGFIVGRDRVAVIDTGGSLREGLALREAIRRVTDRPIAYVVLTHVHPDHTLGAAAFEADTPEFIGHANLPDALARRGEHDLERARASLGDLADGTRLVVPQTLVGDRRELDLGERRLLLRAHPTAHTNTDLSIFDPATGTLWLSDLLFVERIPSLDGSLLGWLRLMDDLDALDAERVVPGHGPIPADRREALGAQRRYLEQVAADVREVIRRRGTIADAVATVAPEEARRWLLFEHYHGRNVTAAFVELEWE